ncbi:MAG TPA: septum formation family protein [Actinomycetaceae bacterium]|nr:septum formation family protein [Actinomycetaceae bacterium]
MADARLLRVAGVGGAIAVAAALTGCSNQSQLFDLEVGDCLNSTDIVSEQVLDVTILNCDTEHDLEVYAKFLMEDSEHPGRDATAAWAQSWCHEQFEPFVGVPYENSALTISWLYPSADTWKDHDDREILCLLGSNEPATGSLKGTGADG